jgi:hypothetical protein
MKKKEQFAISNVKDIYRLCAFRLCASFEDELAGTEKLRGNELKRRRYNA